MPATLIISAYLKNRHRLVVHMRRCLFMSLCLLYFLSQQGAVYNFLCVLCEGVITIVGPTIFNILTDLRDKGMIKLLLQKNEINTKTIETN